MTRIRTGAGGKRAGGVWVVRWMDREFAMNRDKVTSRWLDLAERDLNNVAKHELPRHRVLDLVQAVRAEREVGASLAADLAEERAYSKKLVGLMRRIAKAMLVPSTEHRDMMALPQKAGELRRSGGKSSALRVPLGKNRQAELARAAEELGVTVEGLAADVVIMWLHLDKEDKGWADLNERQMAKRRRKGGG